MNKKRLLKLAFESINAMFENKNINTNDYEQFNEKKGVFVTLKKNNKLRGCIGTIVSQEPLYKTVQNMAIAAAFNDYRFSSVTKEELLDIIISLSLISIPKSIRAIDEIKLGVHGVIFKYQHSQSVFLPEVPIEQGWELIEYLQQLSIKANMQRNDWEKAELLIFSTEKIN
jgi:AmmeMemoRadiSam system protein A